MADEKYTSRWTMPPKKTSNGQYVFWCFLECQQPPPHDPRALASQQGFSWTSSQLPIASCLGKRQGITMSMTSMSLAAPPWCPRGRGSQVAMIRGKPTRFGGCKLQGDPHDSPKTQRECNPPRGLWVPHGTRHIPQICEGTHIPTQHGLFSILLGTFRYVSVQGCRGLTPTHWAWFIQLQGHLDGIFWQCLARDIDPQPGGVWIFHSIAESKQSIWFGIGKTNKNRQTPG